jgi:hypothetical protein
MKSSFSGFSVALLLFCCGLFENVVSAQRLRPIHRRTRHIKSSSPSASHLTTSPAPTTLEFFADDTLLSAASRQLGTLANESRSGHQIIAARSKLILLQLLPGQLSESGEGELLELLASLWESLHALSPAAGLVFLQRYERGTGRGAGDYRSVAQVFASILWQILPLATANRLTRAKYIASLIPKEGEALEKSSGSGMRIDYAKEDILNEFIDEVDERSSRDSIDSSSTDSTDSIDGTESVDSSSNDSDSRDTPSSPIYNPNQETKIIARIFRKLGKGAAFSALLPSTLLPGVPQMQFILSEICWRNGVSTDNCAPSIAAIAHFTSQGDLPEEQGLLQLEAVIDEYLRALKDIEECASHPVPLSPALKKIFTIQPAQSTESELFSVSEAKRIGNSQCPGQAIEVYRFGPYRPSLGRRYLYRK